MSQLSTRPNRLSVYWDLRERSLVSEARAYPDKNTSFGALRPSAPYVTSKRALRNVKNRIGAR